MTDLTTAPVAFPSTTRARSDLATAVRRGLPQPVLDELRADLTAAVLGKALSHALVDAPPMRRTHIEALRALLDSFTIQ